MRVNMTEGLRRRILESVLKPLQDKQSSVVAKIAESREGLVADFLGPELAAAREKLKGVRGMLAYTSYFAFHTVVDGRSLVLNLYAHGSTCGVPSELQVYLNSDMTWEDRKAKCVTLSGPAVDKHADDFREILKLSDRRKTLRTEITALLDKATTLQDVYKVWPSVLEHVDEQTRERFHRKPKPRAAAKAAPPDLELSGAAAIELSKLRLGAV